METRAATHGYNGADSGEVGLHKDLHATSCIIDKCGIECNRLRLQFEAQDDMAGSMTSTAEHCAVVLPSGSTPKQEEKTVGAPVEGTDGQQSSSSGKDYPGNIEPGLQIP